MKDEAEHCCFSLQPSAFRVLVVFSGFQPATDLQTQLAESAAQGVPRDPQPAGGLTLIAARVRQDAGQQMSVHLTMRFRIVDWFVGIPVADLPAG
jgi:hypothetical protein